MNVLTILQETQLTEGKEMNYEDALKAWGAAQLAAYYPKRKINSATVTVGNVIELGGGCCCDGDVGAAWLVIRGRSFNARGAMCEMRIDIQDFTPADFLKMIITAAGGNLTLP